ncbi:MAG: TIGR04086 family membrane protein [Clostridia bacterium]|nr:TIGR04086 family membrane protein [Clostridia bacterium]
MKNTKNKSHVFLIKALIVGVLIGMLTCSIFLILFAGTFVKLGTMPQNVVQILSLASASVGAFIAGYVALRIYKEKGLYIGATAGGFVFVIFTLAGSIASGENLTQVTFIKLVVLIFLGALGGVIGANKKDRRIFK